MHAKKLLLVSAGVILLTTSTTAAAHQPGDIILRIGSATVSPNENSDEIDVAGLTTLQGAGIASDTQLGFTAAYMVTSHVSVALLAATPFNHDISVTGTDINAGEASHLPPTLTLQFYMADPGDLFQPYIGFGINYTTFFDENVASDLNSALDGIVGLPAGTVDADLELEDSTGGAIQLGFDWQVADNWLVSGSIYHINIDTKATIKTAVADVDFDVEIDPTVYMLGFAYKL